MRTQVIAPGWTHVVLQDKTVTVIDIRRHSSTNILMTLAHKRELFGNAAVLTTFTGKCHER